MSGTENAPAAIAAAGDDDIEEFSEEFKCCVCLDLIYKPVVLACGHISCFWCVYQAMDFWQESHCPVCRHPYYHFPKMETAKGTFSPQIENYLATSSSGSEQMTSHGKDCLNRESLEHASSDNNITTGIATNLNGTITKDVDIEGTSSAGNDHVDVCCNQISVNDLLCLICKQLLCRPVVLNCGHVFCEACIVVSNNEPCKCPVCKSMHPNGFPKVCLVLEGFLKQHVSEEYNARIKLKTLELANSSTGAKCSSVLLEERVRNSGHKVHIGVGCDYCGMTPIIGNRYKCMDCIEKIGFDLCEDCYKSSSNLSGRFNQQHKPDHKFEVQEPIPIIFLPADFAEDHAPENESDGSTSPDTQQGPEGDVAGPAHPNDTSGRNEGL